MQESIMNLLDIPSDRTDLFIILGVLFILTVCCVLIWVITLAKNKPSRILWGVFSVICVVLSVGLVVALSGNEDVLSAKEAATLAESKIDTTVSYADIYNAYEENEIVADNMYDGKRYRITARITSISNNGFLGLSSGAALWMEADVNGDTQPFIAEFDATAKQALNQYVVGDTITFEGECARRNFKKCKIVD